MTDVHDTKKVVEKTESFKEFKHENPDDYLAHVFCQVKDEHPGMEFGYYNKKNDRITVFTSDPVERRLPEEVFKESGTLEKLPVGKVKIGLKEVRGLAEKYCQENYPAHPVTQAICILQQARPVWNLTLVTSTLNMLNLRYDAVSGALQHAEIRNIMDLRKT